MRSGNMARLYLAAVALAFAAAGCLGQVVTSEEASDDAKTGVATPTARVESGTQPVPWVPPTASPTGGTVPMPPPKGGTTAERAGLLNGATDTTGRPESVR